MAEKIYKKSFFRLNTYDGGHSMTKAKDDFASLQSIPGIGPNLAADLIRLGIRRPRDLKGQSPELLYEKLCGLEGGPVDRCVLYSFRCAVYYANEDNPRPELLKWWNWKDGRSRP